VNESINIKESRESLKSLTVTDSIKML